MTSWGDGCAERTFGSYSRLDALRSWISSIPGATDGAAGTGGPGGTMPIVALRRESGDFTHVTLAWAAPASGTAPERYAVWQRTTVEGERVDRLIGITPRTRFRAATNATTQPNAFMWNVRPLDAAGSNGSEATIQAGPDPDRVRPSTPPALRLVRAGTASLIVRWNTATDPQSGIASYQVQRRPAGRLSFATVEFTQQRSSTIEQLGSGQRVLVRVRAIDQAGNASGWSPARSFTTR